MKKVILTSALIFGFAVAAQADVIAVIDGGGPTSGDSSHSLIIDFSTGGDTIGAMTGTFASDASNWRLSNPKNWNQTEWDFGPSSRSRATFTFGGLADASEWEVYATWITNSNRSTVAPFTIQGGAAITVNQEPVPRGDLVLFNTVSTLNHNFQSIGTGIVGVDGLLVVTLSGAADDWVDVDAVVIRDIPEPSSAALLLGLAGIALVARRRK